MLSVNKDTFISSLPIWIPSISFPWLFLLRVLVQCWIGMVRENILAFSYNRREIIFHFFILFMGFSRQEYWSGLPFPSPANTFCQTSPLWPSRPGWPHTTAWLSFIELDKAVVLVWLDWLVFCDYAFSVSALWCPLATPTILLGFLLPWTWGISSGPLQQSAAAAPYLGGGVSPHSRPSWPWMWSSSSRPSCTCTGVIY